MYSFSTVNLTSTRLSAKGPPVQDGGESRSEDKTMKSIIRKDEAAVSPVIATILMVAITVVLAAVLYVMVSGLLTPTGGGPRAIGVLPGRSQDGTNWTLTFTSVPSGLTTTGTKLTIITGGGATALTGTAFSVLTSANYGATGCTPSATCQRAAYIQSVVGSAVGVGDRVLISTATYPTGYTYQLSDGTSILAAGTLQ